MRLPEAPAALAGAARPVLDAGKTLGLRLSVIAAPTRAKALEIAYGLRERADQVASERVLEHSFIARSDSASFRAMYDTAGSTEWVTPLLWTGLVRSHGAPAVALVGNADEIADGLIDFARAGASQFILSAWPKSESMQFFGTEVLPRVRRLERLL
jgi:alkanesulfonate monooxygenase